MHSQRVQSLSTTGDEVYRLGQEPAVRKLPESAKGRLRGVPVIIDRGRQTEGYTPLK